MSAVTTALSAVSDLDRAVFVPAIMSAGLVFSLLTVVRDAFAARSRHGGARRQAIAAVAVASDVLSEQRAPGEQGLRPRRFYLIVAIAAVAAALYLVPGAILNYGTEGGYVSRVAWLLVSSLIVALLAVGAAFVGAATWWSWPSPPAWARRAIAATPLGAAPRSVGADQGGGVDPVLGGSLAAVAVALSVVTLAVGSARRTFLDLDEAVLEAVVDWDIPKSLDRLAVLGRTEVAVPLALLIGVSTMRCRPFALGWVTAVAGAFGLDTLAKAVVERPRPPTSVLAIDDSFPSGHVVQATLLALAAPLALRILTDRRWPGRIAGVLFGGAALMTAVERVHSGSHWPSDALGGALIGLLAGLAVRWSIAHDGWHVACRGCPWRPVTAPARPAPRRWGPAIPITPHQAHLLREVALFWLLLTASGLVLVVRTTGLPANPEGDGALAQVEGPAQLVLFALGLLGGLLAARWPPVGATTIAVAAYGLGLLASVENPPWVAIAVTVSIAGPALLLWLAWQHVRTMRAVVALAVVTSALLIGEGTAATRVYDHFFGPAHPQSATAGLPVDLVEWAWSGDLRTDGATVVGRLADTGGGEPVTLEVAAGGARRAAVTSRPDRDGVVRLRATGLEAQTTYRWWIAVGGERDEGRGQGSFTTAPVGPASFTVAAGSCARTGSNGAVYDAIRAVRPLLYLATGDLHYSNLAATDTPPFLRAYGRVLTAPAQAALFRSVPVDYVWDDHDYGPNDADASSPGRGAARAAYRQAVPHPPLASDGAIHHAFTIGRVRFVVTDTRSERTPASMLGAEQLAWLLDELAAADRWGLVVWVNPDPWIAPPEAGRDDWGGYPGERQEIADAIAAAGVDNLVMLSGDAHMVAIDDGTNSDFSTHGGGGFPVLHAAALDRPGSVKGGPYSVGAVAGAGQFGVLHIDDDGTRVAVDLEGRDWEGTVLLRLRFVAGG